MPKSLITALLIVGILFFLFGIIFSPLMLIIGLISLGAGLYLGLGPDGILRKDQILDTWSMLIGNAQGKSNDIFQDTEDLVTGAEVPTLKMERKAISPGIMRGLFGTTREFLVVTDETRVKLQPYKVFINARDYGNNLDVSWYLTYRPPLWQSIASLIPFASVATQAVHDLDIFDQQDLRAYVTVAHHSLIKAVEKVMFSLNQDPSKIDRQSKGFLGIS